jgi:NADP-dependent 3-hydroxy acid dehydrogenase YdfG
MPVTLRRQRSILGAEVHLVDTGVAIITGASSGLGAGTAAVFARAGWDVALAARSAERLDGVAERLAPGGVISVPTDVADPDAVDALVARAVDALWRQVVDVNLNGVFYTSKAVFGPMRSRGSGYIVNVSSVAGRKGWANAAAYCATKFALTGFTQALAGEGAPHGIRCSVMYPGGMDTNWHDTEHPEFLQPEDVGRFLLHVVTRPAGMVANEIVITPVGEQGYP